MKLSGARHWPVALLLLLIPAPPLGVPPPYARARAGGSSLMVGVHAPNRPWREADYARVAEGHFGTVKQMSYHPPETYARLRRDTPAIQFVVRLDTPWNELPPPERFATAQAPYLRSLVEAGYEPWVELGNEPNLELHPGAEAAFARWYLDTLRALRAAVPQAKYGFPGLAENRRQVAWLEANAAAVEASDWLGVHAYWQHEREMLDPGHALEFIAYHRRFPHLPVLITEAGNNAYGISTAERARQYARFTRTVARLPYVRALHFFILNGTPEWQRFFFDGAMVAAVRDASREPAPLLDGLLDARRFMVAAVQPLLGRGGSPDSASPSAGEMRPDPAPTPAPFARRRLLADHSPGTLRVAAPATPDARWVPLRPGEPAHAGLRTASAYFATDFSVRAEVAPPLPGVPIALQLAEADLFAGGGEDATGFALRWDGERWRLQYWRAGTLEADLPLAAVPAAASLEGEWLLVELALEPRSAAAWVWRRDEPQPAQPSAVFAPPEAAAQDGARPRFLFLPAHLVANVILEGATRDAW